MIGRAEKITCEDGGTGDLRSAGLGALASVTDAWTLAAERRPSGQSVPRQTRSKRVSCDSSLHDER